ncbi:glycosyltransferase [Desulfonatronovibrio magnus]|uniref:glycosyltransferase n=1 Tax=Desulfonatronovibrio magnus TaxID=698827 RepID=UPI0005EADE62|nr:glycosyltransferase [Desulfonatronovibrio magnus]
MDNNDGNKAGILVLSSTFPRWHNDSEPGFVYELSRRLANKFNITVLAPRSPGAKDEEVMAGMRVLRFGYFFRPQENLATHSGGIMGRLKANPLNYLLVPFFLLGQLLALIKILRQEQLDIIHAHWIIPQGLAAHMALALTRKQIPVVCTSHGGDMYALQGRIFSWLKKKIVQKCQVLTVVSHALQKEALKLGAHLDKVKVIPMGVDLKNTFVPDLDVKRTDHELVFVGRLVEKKGVEVLIKAMAEILATRPETRLTIAGSGPLENDLKALTASLNLSDKVKFLGMIPQNQLPQLYQKAALAVFPFVRAKSGDQEGLGLVIVEAMGCKCPVIASDIPAVHDTVIHNQTGILVQPGSPQDLAQAVITALDDTTMCRRIAAAARQRVEHEFDWEITVEKFGRIFVDVRLAKH